MRYNINNESERSQARQSNDCSGCEVMKATAERNTKQKETIRRIFMDMRTHPTAEHVFDEVRRLEPSIGRATVYRTLTSLANNGDILKIPVSDGADRYDFNIVPHSHVKCELCGAVDDVFTSEPDDAIPKIVDCRGYIIRRKTVLYYGICPKCAVATPMENSQNAET